MRAIELDPRTLVPNPWNSNKVSEDNMQKLKRSITDLGFATAVVVRETPSGDYEILGGQHRTEAAIELGLTTVPVVNLGDVDDIRAKKISLVDNHRYGNDDVIQLAKIIEEIGEDSADLETFMPVSTADIDAVLNMVELDLDEIGLDLDEDDDDTSDDGDRPERAPKTHDVLKFRLTLRDAEEIRQAVEKTIKREGFTDNDEMTNAGDALAHLLLTVEE
ncbi:MAG: ParB/RepB/Spo0J family partition protein [Hyphomonas sp.]|nr:ParB/RepB/Spo0J family partition protein [Hyphomonas sp.]